MDGVNAKFQHGQIHALLGENGAGKSTIIKLICGLLHPDSGQICYDFRPLHLASYHDAIDFGIYIVNQEIQVVPDCSVAENILLDKLRHHCHPLRLSWKRLYEIAWMYMEQVGLDVPPSTRIRELSAAQKQLVQIAKALSSRARILLLDEPTSSLTYREVGTLFELLKRLRQDNIVAIFVSHKLEEVFELCDRVTVLRDGRLIGSADTGTLTKNDIVRMMIGRESIVSTFIGQPIEAEPPIMEVRQLSRKGVIHEADFSIQRGEILGFYGLVGSGRTELARILVGRDRHDRGKILIRGESAHIRSVHDALRRYRLGYMTENRKEEGLFLNTSVKMNVGITILNELVAPVIRFIVPRLERELTRRWVGNLDIRILSESQTVKTLSGGNQQKVSIAKWLAAGCDILIIDEPTVGVDIGAKRPPIRSCGIWPSWRRKQSY